jgi:hypothetical protein
MTVWRVNDVDGSAQCWEQSGSANTHPPPLLGLVAERGCTTHPQLEASHPVSLTAPFVSSALSQVREHVLAELPEALGDRVGADGCEWHPADRELFLTHFSDLAIIQQYVGVRERMERLGDQVSFQAPRSVTRRAPTGFIGGAAPRMPPFSGSQRLLLCFCPSPHWHQLRGGVHRGRVEECA